MPTSTEQFKQEVVLALKDEFSKNAEKAKKQSVDLSAALKLIGSAAVVGGIVKVSQAFIVQERAVQRLNTSLASNPNITAGASRRLQDFATSLQRVTTVGDEAILAQQAFLASLKFSEQQIKDIISASLDLSAATGMSLESAVRNTTKTLSGMQGELGELIPQLKELTVEQLKAGEGVELLARLFAGQATEASKTFGGQIQQLSNNFGDLQETLGALVAGGAQGSGLLGMFNEAINFLNFSLGGGTELDSTQVRITELVKELANLQRLRDRIANMPAGRDVDESKRAQRLAELDEEIANVNARLDSQVETERKLKNASNERIDVQIEGSQKLSKQEQDRIAKERDAFLKFNEQLIMATSNRFTQIEMLRQNDLDRLDNFYKEGIIGAEEYNAAVIRSAQKANSAVIEQTGNSIGTLSGILTSFQGDFSAAVSSSLQQVGSAVGGTGGAIAATMGQLVGFGNAIASLFGGTVRSAFEAATDALSEINQAVSGLQNRLDTLRGEESKTEAGSVVTVDSKTLSRFLKDQKLARTSGDSFFGFGRDVRLEIDENGDIFLTDSKGGELGGKRGDTGEIFTVGATLPGWVEGIINNFGRGLRRPSQGSSASFTDFGPRTPEPFTGFNTRQFNSGGLVGGYMGNSADSMSARLASGEFVVNRRAVNSRTLGYLNRLNAGMEISSGDGSTFVIQAIDSKSFEEFLRRKGANVMRTLSRNEGVIVANTRGVRQN